MATSITTLEAGTVRVVLRDLDRTLTTHEANVLRDRIYAALHQGTVWTWAAGG